MERSNPAGRIERKKEETRRKIVAVAMRLFRENGFDATAMERIAAEADIAKGTLYNYFPVKEAIVDEYIRRSFADRYDERIARLRALPDTRSRVCAVLAELIQGIQAQPELFEKYFVYQIKNMLSLHRDAGMKSGFRLVTAEIVALGQAGGELRTDLPRDILIALFEFAFVEVAQEYYAAPAGFRAGEVIAQCVDLCLSGAKRL